MESYTKMSKPTTGERSITKGIQNLFGREYTFKNITNLQKTLVTYIETNQEYKLFKLVKWGNTESDVPDDWKTLINIADLELKVPPPLGTAKWVPYLTPYDIISRRMDQLIWCSKKGYTIMAIYLINKIYRPIGSYGYRSTTFKKPLIEAIDTRNMELIKNILDKGTDPNILGRDGSSVLTWLISIARYDTMRKLRDNSIPIDSHIPKIVKLLLDKGADPNIKYLGKTPLMLAIEARSFEIVKLLLEKGANVYKKDMRGRTVIMTAKDTENEKIINLLKQYATSVPVMTETQFNDCEKYEGKVLCAISIEDLDQSQAVNPPPDGSTVCYDRSLLQKWLKTHKKNPHTNTPIDDEWINTWYPLGLDEDYNNHMFGGKRRKGTAKKNRRKKSTRRRRSRKRRTKTKRNNKNRKMVR